MTGTDNSVQKNLDTTARILRILTVPQVFVLLMSLCLYLHDPGAFGETVLRPILICLFLAVIPSLGYLIQILIPSLKEQGRPLQRKLAFLCSAVGYTSGLIWGIASGSAPTEKHVYISYFISFLLLAGFNFLMRIRSSGHAAGIAGPLCILVLEISPWLCFACIPVWLAGLWASVRLKRHTVWEYLLGTACSLGAVGAAWLLVRLFE